MTYFKIGQTDFSNLVSGLKVGYEVLLSEDSGRNAKGNTVIDIVNRKKKIYVSFRAMNEDDMASLLNAIESFQVSISFRNPKTKALQTGLSCYIGTPEPEYYCIQSGKIWYKPMELNFVEL